MDKAFIFDMDGVLIDSERAWQAIEKSLLERILGKEIADQMGSTIGLNATQLFEKAKSLGSSISFEVMRAEYEEFDPLVY